MRLALVTVLAVICGCLPNRAFAECGYENVTISGSTKDKANTCQALHEVLGYFYDIGFKFDPVVRVSHRDNVFIDLFGEATDEMMQVSGCYDPVQRSIQITSGDSGRKDERRPWGIKWGEEMAYSILQHEMVHMGVKEVLGEDYKGLDRVWNEFIAYAVQFELMAEDLRAEILENYPETESFKSLLSINAVTYAADPDSFGIRAYLYAQEHGGRQLVRGILSNPASHGTDENVLMCLGHR